jgi:MFS family permease
MTTGPAALARPRPYYGWVVVFCAFMVALIGWGLGFYGSSVYLAELGRLHGWSASAVGSAITLHYLAGSACLLFAGDAIGRWGAHRVVLGAGLTMIAGVALLTAIDAVWQLYLAFLVTAVGWAGLSGAAVNTIVAPWFDRRRGLAISLALNGASGGGVIVAPLLMALIAHLGFRAGTLSLLALTLLALIPVVWALRFRGPEDLGLLPDGMPRAPGERGSAPSGAAPIARAALMRDPGFLTVVLPFSFGLTAQVGFLTHLVAFARPALGNEATAWCLALASLAALVGRVGTGLFVDRIDVRRGAAANFVLQIGALALLLSSDAPAAVFIGCVLYGLGVGNMITFPGLIVQREFPPALFPRVISLVVAINQVTFAFGPALLGALRDWSGSYAAALIACLVLEAIAAGLVLLRRRALTNS